MCVCVHKTVIYGEQWLDHQFRELWLQSCGVVSNLDNLFTSHSFSLLICIADYGTTASDYLASDNGGYLCMDNLCASISVCLNASKRS